MELFFKYANTITVWIILISQLPSLVLSVLSLIRPTKLHPTTSKQYRYAILIAARNEEAVIGQLIDSLLQQTYPADLIDILVVADNCTDQTAAIARSKGATVVERFNQLEKSKGFAMKFLLEQTIDHSNPYDAFVIFDADNFASPNYIEEMNKAFADGETLITSYRASKNFSSNWISSSSSLVFLRKNRFLHRPRQLLNSSTTISGTGFLISKQLLQSSKDWQFCGLTEDLEITAYHQLRQNKITYCESAVFYDEQPISFKDSWNQRIRWVKGTQQAKNKIGPEIIKTFIKKPRWSLFELLLWVLPVPLIIVTIVLGLILSKFFLIWLYQGSLKLALIHLLYWWVVSYIWSGIMGALVVVVEWNKIHAPWYKKIGAILMYPIWLYSFVAIIFVAYIQPKVEWKAIHHRHVMTEEDGLPQQRK